jgi:hypothetical protein
VNLMAPMANRRMREAELTVGWLREVKSVPVDRELADRLLGSRLVTPAECSRWDSRTTAGRARVL